MFVGVCAVQRLFICLCFEALAATVGQLWEEASGASSGRKLVVHGSVKPWQLLSVSSERKLVVLSWGLLQAGNVSSGRKLVSHGAVMPWQLLSVI